MAQPCHCSGAGWMPGPGTSMGLRRDSVCVCVLAGGGGGGGNLKKKKKKRFVFRMQGSVGLGNLIPVHVEVLILLIYKGQFLFVCFCLFRAAQVAYGGSQAVGCIGATAARLCHSHSHSGSDLHLQPMP